MAEFTIESNGRIEKTALYYNGEQLGGVKEVFLNLDECGSFDAIIQYLGSDGNLHSKQIFEEHLSFLKTCEPSFTEEEAESLKALTLQSDGNIENTLVFFDGEELGGITSLFVHIKAPTPQKNSLANLFKAKQIPEEPEFKAEITFRDEDDSLETESIF